MDLIISNSSNRPIYEQITTQIKELILTGELQPGQKLPSIRALANGLRISAITTKRAYTDLEAQGSSKPCRARAASSPAATSNCCARSAVARSSSDSCGWSMTRGPPTSAMTSFGR